MWGAPSDMALDQGTNCCHPSNGPPTDTRGLDSASGFPTLASSKTVSSHMDAGTLDCLQPAVHEKPLAA